MGWGSNDSGVFRQNTGPTHLEDLGARGEIHTASFHFELCELCNLILLLSLSSFPFKWRVALTLPSHRDFALCKQSRPSVCSQDISFPFGCIPFIGPTASLAAWTRLGGAQTSAVSGST